eukprot:TRINITY_DN10798_c0_g1_i1.p1 TRINITY_DN10798_c0_g1~~TRINITY_DN10798_c0_g1_i1.p1  ORF type:complete len:855 (-),score=202.74 TRINITY_DN10798_c0_g1_i1:365-2929(-)
MSATAAEETHEPLICEPGGRGVLFPLSQAEHTWSLEIRGLLYTLALLYLFFGVSIVADKFVAAIETITSKKRRVRQRYTGKYITVHVWNDTVANLTLLALGSSAPEILLSIVEIVMSNFHAGALGPSCIVGSAAFNLFVIVGVCIIVVPSPESRKIKENGVFIVTAFFSLFAYFWLVFIVSISSPDVISPWEGVATLLMFPLLTILSYLADIGWFSSGEKSAGEGPFGGSAVLGGMQELEPPPPTGVAAAGFLGGREAANPAGVLGFPVDTWEVISGIAEQKISVPVIRKGGCKGAVSCSYRTEHMSAMPGYDYEEVSGAVHFEHGQSEAELSLTVLGKRLGESSDVFLLVLEEATGGAAFDPAEDGGSEKAVLSVRVFNANEGMAKQYPSLRISRAIDAAVNLDSLRLGTATWKSELWDAFTDLGVEEGETPTGMDWAMHLLGMPWKVFFAAFLPPPQYAGGWVCFFFSLAYIGGLTTIVMDFAELFGCVTGLGDTITAFTFVALGTSMPDLFASKTAAVQDAYADASIVNVTGSNSVNVFLGIGLPWTIAAFYWAIVGPNEEWTQRYGAEFAAQYPGGAFVVKGGDLVFSVVVFSVAALVALILLQVRRHVCGGELGGPYLPKLTSGLLLMLLWFFYVAMSVWKVTSGATDLGGQVFAIFLGICAFENFFILLLAIVGVVAYFRRRKSADSDAEDPERGLSETGGVATTPAAAEVVGLSPLRTLASAQAHKADALPVFGGRDDGDVRCRRRPGAADGGCVGTPTTTYGMSAEDKSRQSRSLFGRTAMVLLAIGKLKRAKGPERALLRERVPSFHSLADFAQPPADTLGFLDARSDGGFEAAADHTFRSPRQY